MRTDAPQLAVRGTALFRVLSLRPPWGLAVVRGLKPYETRTWTTAYRGTTVIHHSLRPDPNGPWHLFGPDEDMHPGACIGSVSLMHCRPMEPADVAKALCPVTPRRQVWETCDPFEFSRPYQLRGALGLFKAELPLSLWEGGPAR